MRGVSVATKGEAKGHGIFLDDTTLDTLLSAATNRAGGVPVKMDHGTGMWHMVGKLVDFRKDGESLRADLQLVKSHEAFNRIVEMSETMAENFGLSASFERTDEEIGGKKFARCHQLYSVDLVDQPAANPNGLFQTSVDSQEKGMADAKTESFFTGLKNWLGEKENTELSAVRTDLAAAQSKITELTSKVSTLETNLAAKVTELAAKEKELTDAKAEVAALPQKIELAASKKAQEITASLGIPPIASTPAANPAAPQKTELKGLAKTQAAFAAQLKPAATL